MTTTTFTAAPISDTDANFRDWGSKFSAALAAVGMVKTADTGQIDWGTVTIPTAANQDKGYEIWRFNDSLQSTYPLFFKFWYGSGAYGATSPNVKTNIGKGSSGAGALTSQYSSTRNSYPRNGIGTSATWYMSSVDGSSLCWANAPSLFSPGDSTWQIIERGRSVNGSPFGGSFVLSVFTPTSSAISHYTDIYSYGATTAQNNMTCGLPVTNTNTSMAYGGTTAPLSPFLVSDLASAMWQPRAYLRGMAPDLPPLTPITVPGWGTYLPLGNSGRPSTSDWFTHAIAWS